jgi:hypothetical protein
MTADITKPETAFDLSLYSTFSKIDFQNRCVEGVFTSEALDSQNEIVDWGATKEALKDYRKFMNVREMHRKDSAVGVGLQITEDDEKRQAIMRTHVVDDGAWAKVCSGVYKGYSIGGKKIEVVPEMAKSGVQANRIKKYFLGEVSLVDRPSNPEGIFSIAKRDFSKDDDSGVAIAAQDAASGEIQKGEGALDENKNAQGTGQAAQPQTVTLSKAQLDELMAKADKAATLESKVTDMEKRLVESEEKAKKEETFKAELEKRFSELEPMRKALVSQPDKDELAKMQEAVKKMPLGELALKSFRAAGV